MIYAAGFTAMLFLRLSRLQAGYPVLLVVLFLFSAFRYQVGCDWLGYENQYQVFGTARLSDLMTVNEPLWTAIIMLQVKLDLPYPWLNVISSAIFFFGVHRLAIRQPDRLGFLILLFPVLILNMPMSGIRQGAAIGLICMAFNAFSDRKLLRYVFIVLIAGSIHSSASIFLLLAPLVQGGLTRGRLLLCVLLAIPGMLGLMGTDMANTATTRYVGTGIDSAGASYRIALLLATSVLFFLVLQRPWARSFPQDYKLVAVGSLLMLATGGILILSTVIGDRLGYYFVPIQAMILARLPRLPLRTGRALLTAAPYFVLFAVLVVWITFSDLFSGCYLPYQSWILGLPE